MGFSFPYEAYVITTAPLLRIWDEHRLNLKEIDVDLKKCKRSGTDFLRS